MAKLLKTCFDVVYLKGENFSSKHFLMVLRIDSEKD